MKLIVSHFTSNLGTTDYYLSYLREKNTAYYYLRHPFGFEETLKHSELIYFDGKTEFIVGKYKKFGGTISELLRVVMLNGYISLRLGFRIQEVYGFGGFNIFGFLWLRIFQKKIYFWGTDYSRKRFPSFLLNRLYSVFETLGCLFSTSTISSSERQEQARIKYHWLNPKRSIVISNGIQTLSPIQYNFNQHTKPAFIYIGSITDQHGILDFIRYMYQEIDVDYPLFIFGGGEKEKELEMLLLGLKSEKIIFYGNTPQGAIQEFIEKSEHRLYGIAPYTDTINDHVYYGDSLKIKEYLNYGIPYIISNVVHVPDGLRELGIQYKKLSEVIFTINKSFYYEDGKIKNILPGYVWNKLFSKLD